MRGGSRAGVLHKCLAAFHHTSRPGTAAWGTECIKSSWWAGPCVRAFHECPTAAAHKADAVCAAPYHVNFTTHCVGTSQGAWGRAWEAAPSSGAPRRAGPASAPASPLAWPMPSKVTEWAAPPRAPAPCPSAKRQSRASVCFLDVWRTLLHRAVHGYCCKTWSACVTGRTLAVRNYVITRPSQTQYGNGLRPHVSAIRRAWTYAGWRRL